MRRYEAVSPSRAPSVVSPPNDSRGSFAKILSLKLIHPATFDVGSHLRAISEKVLVEQNAFEGAAR